jgi:GDP-4-dehydro-6-deoxy-D-mannose reductase
MKVLVTGITGFVGSHLAEALVSLPGIEVHGTTFGKPTENIKANYLSDISLHSVDISEPIQVHQIISQLKPEKIFHLAGQAFVPHSVSDPVTTFQTNINGTVNILEAVRSLKTTDQISTSVLVVSSGEVYGSVPAEQQPIDESVRLSPNNPYATSKACADLLAQQYHLTFGLNVVVVRPFNHLGPRQSDLFVGSAFAKQVAEIKLGIHEPKLMVGNLEPERDFTDVRDVVNAYIKLLESPRQHSVYNVCSDRAVSIRSLLDTLCMLSGIAVEIIPDSARLRRNDTPRITGNSSRLRSETNWKPSITLERTLQDLLSYWEEQVHRSS